MAADRKYGSPVDVVSGGASFANASAVTASDLTPLPNAAAALWIGGTGSVVLVTINAQAATFNSVPAGTLLPVAVAQVMETGTTATGIVALW